MSQDATTEQFRADCEARWCLQQPKAERSAYYRAVLKARGKDGARRLIDAVNRMYSAGVLL